jgi:iron(III) transport system substrate-binding protein
MMARRTGFGQRAGWPGLAVGMGLALLAACGGPAASGAGSANTPSGGAGSGASAGGASGGASSPASPLTYAAADRDQVLRAGAQREAALSWYTSGTLSVVQALAQAFEAQYPGIKVDLTRADDSTIITKVTEEGRAGRTTVDVVETTVPGLKVMKEAGHFAEYYLPNAAAYPAAAKEPGSGLNLYWAVDREHYYSFAYNTNLLPASAVPKDLAGLLAPALKGQMAIPGTSTGVNFVGQVQTSQAPDYLPRLAQQNLKVQMISAEAVRTLVVKGEIAASPTVAQAGVMINKAEGAPIAWVPLAPVTANAGAVAIVAKAPHPHVAALFAQFLLGPDGQQIYKDNYFGLAGTDPGFPRWYPDEGRTADQYEQAYEGWKKELTDLFVTPAGN